MSRSSLRVQARAVSGRDAMVAGSTTKRADEVDRSLEALSDMDGKALRVQWRRLYRSEPPCRVTHELLILALAWKLQAKAYGGLRASSKRRLESLAGTLEQRGDLGGRGSVELEPGTRLVREWQGRTYNVEVVEEGFAYRGRRYRSLSAVARAITGTRWSGRRFFGLKQRARGAQVTGGGDG